MPTNDFKALALGGSNRAAKQANYVADTDLITNGFPTGVVDSLKFNKALRQSSFVAAVIGQTINDQAGVDALDDGVVANLEAGFLRALRRFSTNGMYGVDTGSAANVYQVPYSPAVNSVIDGEVFKFRAAHANTGASTFTPNPGTIAVAPIWGADHAALVGGEIILNGDVWVQWNSALNSGSGAWVLVDSTGGYIKSPTPTTGDRSQKVATTQMFSNEFGSSIASSGYQKLPSGLIFQWFTASFTITTSDTVYAANWPVAFPNGLLSVEGTYDATPGASVYPIRGVSQSTTAQAKATLSGGTGGSASVKFFGIGN